MVPTAQGKLGKRPIKFHVKNPEFLFAQAVSSLILEIQDIVIFTAKFLNILKSVLPMKLNFLIWHRENCQFYRENTGNL